MGTKIIICRDCCKEFDVSKFSKRILCDECKKKSQQNHFKYFVEQKILCRRLDCNNVVKVITKKGTKAKPKIRGGECCDECKKKSKFKIMEQEVHCKYCHRFLYKREIKMTHESKAISYKGVCKDCHDEKIKNVSKINSERLTMNNPMHDKDTVEKMKTTMKSRIESGEIVYNSGSEHHLFKGLRIFGQECRSQLYQIWIKPILERDNFKCTKCGDTSNLQVHHIISLRDIIEEVFNSHNLNYKNSYFTCDEYGVLFDKLLNEVLKKHSLDIGITLCKKCHANTDYYYRPYKGVVKNENKID